MSSRLHLHFSVLALAAILLLTGARARATDSLSVELYSGVTSSDSYYNFYTVKGGDLHADGSYTGQHNILYEAYKGDPSEVAAFAAYFSWAAGKYVWHSSYIPAGDFSWLTFTAHPNEYGDGTVYWVQVKGVTPPTPTPNPFTSITTAWASLKNIYASYKAAGSVSALIGQQIDAWWANQFSLLSPADKNNFADGIPAQVGGYANLQALNDILKNRGYTVPNFGNNDDYTGTISGVSGSGFPEPQQAQSFDPLVSALAEDAETSGVGVRHIDVGTSTPTDAAIVTTDGNVRLVNPPVGLQTAVNSAAATGQGIIEVALKPGGSGWIILYGTNGFMQSGMPASLVTALTTLQSQGRHIREVIFRKSDTTGNTWMILYDTNSFVQSQMPSSLITTLQLFQSQGSPINTVYVHPDGSWVIVGGDPDYSFHASSDSPAPPAFINQMPNLSGEALGRARIAEDRTGGFFIYTDQSPVGSHLVSPAANSTLSGTSANFIWSAGYRVQKYNLSIGNSPGSDDIYSANFDTSTPQTIPNLPDDGRPLYVRLYSKLNGVWSYTDYTFTAYTDPSLVKAQMLSPADGSTLTPTTTFTWDAGMGAQKYILWVGNAPDTYDIFAGEMGTLLSKTFTNLPDDGRPLYVRLYSMFHNEWHAYNSYVYTAYTAPAPAAAEMVSPADGSTLLPSTTFAWSTGNKVEKYILWVGSAPGAYDLFAGDMGTALFKTLPALPDDGRAIYVSLQSRINGVWQTNNYTYTAYTAPPATLAQMLSPADGSILSTTATFTWDTGSRAQKFALWVGSSPGSYDIYSGDEGTNLTRTLANLPSNGLPVYVRLWTFFSATDLQFNSYVYTAISSNANLSNLTSSAGSLAPAFAGSTTAYTASVPNTTTSVTVTPSTAHASATVKVNGATVTPGSASNPISLNVGANTITVVTTAQDGSTIKTYTIVVTRAPSSIATLSTLTPGSGTLTPAFATATAAYTMSVPNTTTSLTLTPTVTEPNATVKINGATVTSGSASNAIPLVVGTNVITTVVTAQDGSTKTYTLTVTRPKSTDATLSGLTPSAGTLAPAFAAATTSYSIVVPNSAATITLTPTVTEPNATVKINSATVASGTASNAITLNVGSANTITTVVTAQDGTTVATYTITLTRAQPPVVADYTADDTVPFTTNGYDATGNTVTFALDYVPTTGVTLMVVNNTGNDFIHGAFTNLTQGQKVTLSYHGISYKFVANYYGGTGNDLVLQWADVSAMAWGYNADGELGNNSTANSSLPVPVTSSGALAGKTIVAISSGYANMALCSDSTIVTWGHGNLGNGTGNTSSVPIAIPKTGALAGKTIVSISAGFFNSLALCSDGTIVSWGGAVTSPVTVATTGPLAGKTVTAISAGFGHDLALCSDGTLVAWGSNGSGALGDGTTNNSTTPIAITSSGILAGKTVTAISAGCYQNLVLCADGTLAAWGYNTSGQVGNGTTTTSTTPIAVNLSGVLAGKTPSAISCQGAFIGAGHSLALCTDGTLAAWGSNFYGELGNNSSANSSLPVTVISTGVLSGRTVTTISAGHSGNLALCSDGTLATWGYNNYGQLGNGGTTNSSVPATVSTSSLQAGQRFIEAKSQGSYSLALVASPPAATSPVVYSPATTSGTINTPFTFDVLASGSPTNYSTTGLPTGLTIDSTTGIISGTPTQFGKFTASLALTNTVGKSTTPLTVVIANPANADLQSLTSSTGTLTPAFDPAVTAYAANVPYATASVTITPTAVEANATLSVADNAVTSGSPSAAIALNVGDNTITTTVTSPDTSITKTYTLTVTRQPAPPPPPTPTPEPPPPPEATPTPDPNATPTPTPEPTPTPAANAKITFGSAGGPWKIPSKGSISNVCILDDKTRTVSGKVTLAINIRHAWRGDLAVYFVAPNGRRELVWKGDPKHGGKTLRVTEHWATSFRGSPLAGKWTLVVQDRYRGHSGSLISWSATAETSP